jgi:hypothetical protein
MTGSKKSQSILSSLASVITGRNYSKSKKSRKEKTVNLIGVKSRKNKPMIGVGSRKMYKDVMDSLTNNAYSKHHKGSVGYKSASKSKSMHPKSGETYRHYVKRTFHPAKAIIMASGQGVANGSAATMKYIGNMWSASKSKTSKKRSSRYADAKSHFTWFWDKKETKVEDKPMAMEVGVTAPEMPPKKRHSQKKHKHTSKKHKHGSKKHKHGSKKHKHGSKKHKKRSTSYASKSSSKVSKKSVSKVSKKSVSKVSKKSASKVSKKSVSKRHRHRGLVNDSYNLARDTGVSAGKTGTSIFSKTTRAAKNSNPYKVSSKKHKKKSMWSEAYASKSASKVSKKSVSKVSKKSVSKVAQKKKKHYKKTEAYATKVSKKIAKKGSKKLSKGTPVCVCEIAKGVSKKGGVVVTEACVCGMSKKKKSA